MVHLLPHWTHPGKEGVEIPVVVYTNCEAAELFLNGISLGKKDYVGEQLVWLVPYQQGEISVKAYDNGEEVASKAYHSAGNAAGFDVKADKKIIRANEKDVIHLEIDVVDKNGYICPLASNLVEVEVSGPAAILAMDNGDPIELTPYKVNQKKAFRGKCLLMLQATAESGTVIVKLNSQGLETKTVQLSVLPSK
jgi:beta-galactosidase